MTRIHRWLWQPAPAERLATVRALVGTYAVVYLLIRSPVMVDFGRFARSSFEPVGVIRVLDGPLPAWLVGGLYGATVLTALAVALGFRQRVAGPAFGLLVLWTTSYRNSWGMVFHTDNLLTLHALWLGLCPAAEALSLDASGRATPPADGRFGFALKVLSAITAITYVLAGIAKLKHSGLAWMEGEILRNYIAYDAVRKLSVGSLHSPLGAWLVQYGAPFAPIGWLTMVIELGAPLALVGQRIARPWVVLALGFHWGVLAVMAIAFPYPLSGVAFASMLRAERIWRWPVLAHLHRRTARWS